MKNLLLWPLRILWECVGLPLTACAIYGVIIPALWISLQIGLTYGGCRALGVDVVEVITSAMRDERPQDITDPDVLTLTIVFWVAFPVAIATLCKIVDAFNKGPGRPFYQVLRGRPLERTVSR